MRVSFWIGIVSLLGIRVWGQTDTLSVRVKDTITVPQTVILKTWNTDPLSPARAAFYSSILPGLGQAYNKSYWKIPIVYLAIGIPTYLYFRNDKELDRYRTAYKSRLDGRTDDEFYGGRTDGNPRLSTDALRRAQDLYRRNKEMAMLFAIGFYALNIIEANVDAHLKQFNVDENLSIEPFLHQNRFNNSYIGISLTYNF
ncbi:DUF5683 domain-containing protein [Capnocytophaga sp. G2]|uniref:DUF5683 domain-containing protein n=1 Tax=Capnocytophaga sp. G2 TaxID=3110695 RepID=UPI002B4735E9|nr:DUF5683 domain-containing protein [Capnocytophaga sp. G2]MEB3005809.1 DUF5683 domain-containing protein [Capnocytophaga sp. G2]